MEVTVGSIVTGKVNAITKFGAFVTLPGGKSGLVHISEVAASFVNDVHDFLQVGQEVQVKVLAVTPEGKINLSIKQAQPAAERPAYRRPAPVSAPSPEGTGAAEGSADSAFEDKLKQFMSASEGKLSDLNRWSDGRRGGHRKK